MTSSIDKYTIILYKLAQQLYDSGQTEYISLEDGIFLHGKNYNIDTVLGDTEESREIIRCTWPSINTLCEYRWREEIQWLVRYFLISSSD